MVCRLIDFTLVVLKLLMFKVCGVIGLRKIDFFNFSGTEKTSNFLRTFGDICVKYNLPPVSPSRNI